MNQFLYGNLPAEPPPEPPEGLRNNDPFARYRQYNFTFAIFIVVGLLLTAGVIFTNLIARPETKASGYTLPTPTPFRFR